MAATSAYGFKFYGLILKILLFLLAPYYWLLSLKSRKRLPPINDELLLMSATKLAENIRSGKIKSENVVRAYVQRIQDVNPILNAVIEENYKEAINEAHAIDELIAKKEKRPEQLAKEKPLLGVPITIKESCAVKGLSYTGCTLKRKNIVADKDGEAVHRIRDAGAIILAVTNTPELCMCWETNNLMTGRTLNPFNTNHAVGGSSGGEGALIGCGSSIAGLGSDLGGSIRMPALFNGVFGHKPTAKIVPLQGHYPYSDHKIFHNLLVIGPLARYAEDMKLIMKVLTKENAQLLKWDEQVNIEKLNIYYKESDGDPIFGLPVDGEIKEVLRNAANYLKTVGANVKPADFLDTKFCQEICCTQLCLMKDAVELLGDLEQVKDIMSGIPKAIKAFFGLSKHMFETVVFQLASETNFLITDVKDYIIETEKFRQTLLDALSDNGVLLYPTFPTPAFQHNQAHLKLFGMFYAMIVNAIGFPATHVPLGLNKAGLPIGIQVIAAPHQDRLCLAVAEELERKFGGWRPPTKIVL